MSDAESVVLRIEAQVDEANRRLREHANVADGAMASVEKSARSAEQAMSRSAVIVVDRTAVMANAQRNLGRQIADVGASLASGSSPFMVLAQQAPQFADAMSDMNGRAAKVAQFFSGPWGAALLAAGSVVAVVASEVLKSGDGVESLTGKLEANSIKARAAADAQKIFETSLYGAADASAKLSERLERQNQTQLQVAQSALAAAEALRQQNIQNLRNEAADAAIARRVAQTTADSSLYVQGGTVGGSSGFGQSLAQARARNELAKATERERVATQGLADAEKAVVNARIPLLDMRAAAATDASTAATSRHEKALGRLRDEFKRSGDEAAYLAGRQRIDRQLSAEQESIKKRETSARKAETEAKRAEAKAARELAKAQNELERSLDQILSRFDPLRSIANATSETLKEIDTLRLNGLITNVDAIAYKLALANSQMQALADAAWKQQEQKWLDVGITTSDMDGSKVRDQINRDVEARRDAQEEAADRIFEKQRTQIEMLAGFFEDAFRGGTDAIWDNFRTMGMRVIAETLARFVIGNLGGSKISIGDALSKSVTALGGIFGGSPARASGGMVGAGKTYLVGERGPEVLRMGGQGGVVIPNRVFAGQPASRMPQQTVIVKVEANDYFDAKVQQGATAVAAPMSVASGLQSRAAAKADATKAARRRIPGR